MALGSRPYRLWDSKKNVAIRWRYYSEPRRAHNSAMIEARWAKVGTTIEVINIDTGKMLGQYTRRITTVDFRGE